MAGKAIQSDREMDIEHESVRERDTHTYNHNTFAGALGPSVPVVV